jgi:predicted SAM-dependent methyltransferase
MNVKGDMGRLKLNLGCGSHHYSGYVNVDIKAPADLVCDCLKLPYKENTIVEITSYHMLEHLTKEQGILALKHWYNILIVGGKLVVEVPDLEGVCKELLNGNDYGFNMLYGLQINDFEYHKWGYTKKSMEVLFLKIGFEVVYVGEGQDLNHLHTWEPCIRIEGLKR